MIGNVGMNRVQKIWRHVLSQETDSGETLAVTVEDCGTSTREIHYNGRETVFDISKRRLMIASWLLSLVPPWTREPALGPAA